MQSNDPHANKRASYAEQAARAGAAPEADSEPEHGSDRSAAHQASFTAPSRHTQNRGADRSLAARGDAEPAAADNVVTGDQAPLHGAASHATSAAPADDDVSTSGGSSTGW